MNALADDVSRWERLGAGSALDQALEGARLALGSPKADGASAYPREVRVLAAAALFRSNRMTAKAAARDCGLGFGNILAPSQIQRTGVTDALIRTVIAYLDGEETPRPAAAPPAPARKERAKRAPATRHRPKEIDPSAVVLLQENHAAVVEGRTLFPSTRVGTMASPRFLVSGHNNTKLGKAVLKGPREGWPIFQVTLEERATCPRTCAQWRGCYGNTMPFARRHVVDAGFMDALRSEVLTVARQYPAGLLIRLHTLGDFFSVPYVLMWAELLAACPQLHVFGYTARTVEDPDPESAKIARAIALLTESAWDRFAIRTSHQYIGPQRAVVVDSIPEKRDVIVCPAQTEHTEACATCGLCWIASARDKTIAFLRHGMTRRGTGRKVKAVLVDLPEEPSPAIEAVVEAPPPPTPPALKLAPLPAPTLAPAARPQGQHTASRPAPRQKLSDAGVTAIRPVRERVLAWCRAYVATGVKVEFLADLFDVDPDQLKRRLEQA